MTVWARWRIEDASLCGLPPSGVGVVAWMAEADTGHDHVIYYLGGGKELEEGESLHNWKLGTTIMYK